jgi:hypothetical protein
VRCSSFPEETALGRGESACHAFEVGSEPSAHPYREEKATADLIAPDRRRIKALSLVVCGIVIGVAADRSVPRVAAAVARLVATAEVRPASARVEARLPNMTLEGPDGRRSLPTGQTTIVHVWLQGCQDCMPAFEAMKSLSAEIETRHGATPVINVAYGEADPSWAKQYAVRQNLVFDRKGALVQALGIGTFTTLVVDASGRVIHRDRPDQPGYLVRLDAVLEGH